MRSGSVALNPVLVAELTALSLTWSESQRQDFLQKGTFSVYLYEHVWVTGLIQYLVDTGHLSPHRSLPGRIGREPI